MGTITLLHGRANQPFEELQSPYQSYRTLGVVLSPSGSTTKATVVLEEKAEDYARKITSSNLTRDEALSSFLMYFTPHIGFFFPVLTLTERQFSIIQSPAIRALLPKLHMNCNTFRSIVFSPELYGGLNLPNAYWSQCYGQLQLLIGHL
jgi:hypothetical protein